LCTAILVTACACGHAQDYPAKTPGGIVGKLHGVLAAAIRDSREMFVSQGQEPGGESGEALAAFMRAKSERYEKVARAGQIPRQ
jgi:tripartite-type tricarboxylate transporter receptor subunit TctC